MEKVWVEAYLANRDDSGGLAKLSSTLESWMHRQAVGETAGTVLEIGAGTLNHLQWESDDNIYDIVEPLAELYEERPELARIGRVYQDISEVDLEPRYDRIVSIAALEHLTDLPGCLARAGLLLKKGGIFQIGIPSEGGFLWGLGWRATSAIAFRLKFGLDWGEHMRHEHVNDAPEIIGLVKHFFGTVRIRRFPLPFHHLSLYCYLEASHASTSICHNHIDRS